MAHGYSHEFAVAIQQRHKDNPDDPVFTLAALCVEKNIVPSEIAARLNVSKQTVYGWFTGGFYPRPDAMEGIKAYTKELKRKTKA